ncbi:MAG: hypothetical protein IJ757_06090 [Clostridiales bacterium]|nr:hypothetical protein [Clostridiales bacterium]
MKNDTKIKIYRVAAIICVIVGTAFLLFSFFEMGTRTLAVGLAFHSIGMLCNIRSRAIIRKNQD